MKRYAVATDYDYNRTHKRDCITVWSGQFCQEYEGTGLALPCDVGNMLTLYGGIKLRVACPCPRTEANYQDVDAAISAAIAEAEGGNP
jgi:hypothetical protein